MRWLLLRATRVFFRRIEVSGAANLPREGEGAAIFCGNHPNSLLDPVLITTYCGRIVHFAAKDVLFQARVLRFFLDALGAVPVKRRTDHPDGRLDNESMFAELHRTLGEGRCVGIFPEGISHNESELAPLKTGAARIALGAKREHPEAPICMVPTGLCYFTRSRFRSSVLVQFGRPIEVTEEMANAADEPAMVRDLTDRLAIALRGLTVNAGSWEQIWVLDGVRRLYQPEGLSLEQRIELSRRFNRVYPRVKDEKEVRHAYDRVRAYLLRLSAADLKDDVFKREISVRETVGHVAEHLTLLLSSLPLCLIGAPIHMPLGLLFRVSKYFAPRKDVIATTKFLVGFLVVLLVYTGLAVGVGWRYGVWWGLLAAVVLPLSGRAFLHVVSRVDALRHMFLTLLRVASLRKEVRALRDERADLQKQVLQLVDKYRALADEPTE